MDNGTPLWDEVEEIACETRSGVFGYVYAGRFVPIIAGGADEPNPAGGEGDDDEEDDEDDDEEDEEDDSTKEDDKPEVKDKDAKIAALESQMDRRVKRDKKRAKELKDALERVKVLEDAGKQPDEKTKSDLLESQNKVKELEEQVTDLSLDIEIMKHPKLRTLPARRAELVKRAIERDLEIDEEDQTTNIDELVDALEKEDPDLFKVASKPDDDDEDEDEEEDKKASGGKPPVGKKKKSRGDGRDKASLQKRFPALGGRGVGTRVRVPVP